MLETGFLFGPAGEQFRVETYPGDFAWDDTLWYEMGDDGAILTGGRQGTFLKLLGEFGWVSALPPLLPGQVMRTLNRVTARVWCEVLDYRTPYPGHLFVSQSRYMGVECPARGASALFGLIATTRG